MKSTPLSFDGIENVRSAKLTGLSDEARKKVLLWFRMSVDKFVPSGILMPSGIPTTAKIVIPTADVFH